MNRIVKFCGIWRNGFDIFWEMYFCDFLAKKYSSKYLVMASRKPAQRSINWKEGKRLSGTVQRCSVSLILLQSTIVQSWISSALMFHQGLSPSKRIQRQPCLLQTGWGTEQRPNMLMDSLPLFVCNQYVWQWLQTGPVVHMLMDLVLLCFHLS